MSFHHQSNPFRLESIRKPDWADDLSLGVAGFCIVIALLQTVVPFGVREEVASLGLSDQARAVSVACEFVIAGLLVCSRSRPLGVMLGAGVSAAISFSLLLGARLDLLPVSLGLLAVFIVMAIRLDRLRQEEPHPRASGNGARRA